MRIRQLLVLLAVVGTIGCDRVTKRLASETLAGTAGHSWLGDTIRLEYAENTGAFLGLGADWSPGLRTTLFVVANTVLLMAMGLVAWRVTLPRAALVGVALFVAGGASNVVDRLAYERVVDFLNVGIGPFRTGIFNVADIAIMAGAGLVAASPRLARAQSRRRRPRRRCRRGPTC